MGMSERDARYRVLIVDDEPLVCGAISRFLLRSELEIVCAEVALNGFEALDYLRMEHYDLVITDIQMGGMSGIELMEVIFSEFPGLPIIVVSAHEDFRFAQQALRLGALDYLIKPVEADHLVATVAKALDKRLRLPDLGGAALKQSGASRQQLFAAETVFLHDWMMAGEGEWTAEELAEGLADHGLALPGPYFGVLKLAVDFNGSSERRGIRFGQRDRKLLLFAVLNVVNESLMSEEALVFYGLHHQIVCIVSLSETEWNDWGREAEAHLLLMARRLTTNLDSYLNLASCIGVSRLAIGLARIPGLYREADAALAHRRREGGQEWTISFIGDLERNGEESTTMDKAMRYIRRSYANKNLKLQDVAREVHLSPNYFSFLFKKATDKNVWDYLTEVRMEEAKRLLLTSDKKRYEIAEMIGYESPEHFSRVFKKYYGVSPADYRK